MPRREDDPVAPRPGAPGTRNLVLAGGFLLAAGATLAVFLTDNPQFLRLAVVAVAWAFVLATVAAGRRGSDRAAARARETALQRAYERELEREVSARREYELELENELRRESEDAMRHELDALRGDIAALSGLQDEVARVSALRGDITALTQLRDEVARLAALRDDVAALSSLRDELGQLAELRADMGRLRAELTEQLSSEMLVERIVMRTQASRLPTESARLEAPGRTVEGQSWADDAPPRELTGGWPAVRLDEPRETQQFEQVRVERAGSRPPVPPSGPPATEARSWETPSWEKPSWERPSWDEPSWERPSWETPGTSTWSATPPPPAPPATAAFDAAGPPPPAFTPPPVPAAQPPPAFPPRPSPHPRAQDPAEPRLWSSEPPAEAHRSRHGSDDGTRTPPTAAFPLAPSIRPSSSTAPPATSLAPIAPPPVTPAEPPAPPLEWLAARSSLDAARGSSEPDLPPRRRRSDDDAPPYVDPASAPTAQRPVAPPPVPADDRGTEPATRGHRVADILADNGVSPPTGSRRRRRYRDEDEPDDVLARVLGRN
ncbi:MAG TPA: DUF6779 domain-containing protein [Blastococcus sp.]|nr:DUF6779 domain-containing protein [Blastococcus sp.]